MTLRRFERSMNGEAVNAALGGPRRRPRDRKLIAALIDHVDHVSGGYEPLLRAAFDAACRKHDLDLMLVVGRPFGPADPVDAAHNFIYDFVSEHSVDGVIFVSAALAASSGPERIAEFRERLGATPVCSVGAQVRGMPSIVVDNRPGMAALMDHLIEGHGRRRVAFITGTPHNPDAEMRLQVYREGLARHGIAFDPELVATGFFHGPSGGKAALELLGRGTPFDALVVSNDVMALSAIEVLKSRGRRVPRDVVVTGFDDLSLARLASPPLTTVRQPLERMGMLAVELVCSQLAGFDVPALVELPVEFVPRESCGCFAQVEALPARGSTFPPATVVAATRPGLGRRVAAAALEARGEGAAWVMRLLEGLELELGGARGELLSALSDALEELGDAQEGFEKTRRALARMREELGRRELEPLWQAAERVIDSAMARAQARQKLEMDVVFQNLLRSGERLSTASLDASGLGRVIAEELAEMRLQNACISLFGPSGELEPYVWLSQGEPRPVEPGDFEAGRFFPRAAAAERRTWFALPLTFESERLGVLACELGAGVAFFEMLRGQISAALKRAALHQEIVRTTALHARSVQERIATSERMASLSVLAGGVAHDLNNALGPLVTLPDVILAELDDMKRGVLADDRELRLDIATIKSSALRAAQTIKDLMMLGRPGATVKQALDLNEVVASALAADPLSLMQQHAESPLRVELALESLGVLGSEPHLVRAVSNLLRNAAEAVENGGEISVSTRALRLPSELCARETVPAGDYAVLRVTDTGEGIAPADLARIFEPFFTKKPLTDKSGGGLGLAIVHGVVKEHGGFIDVESRPGGGTTFELYLQRAPDAVREPGAVGGAARVAGRILVIDDQPAQLHLAGRALRHLGYHVDTLTSGREALELHVRARRARANEGRDPTLAPYDLVIVDFALQEAHDGVKTLRQIRKLYPRQRGIVVSGHAPPSEIDPSFGADVVWLAKPYGADTLASSVRAALAAVSSHRADSDQVASTTDFRTPPSYDA